jgi:hypothetical protein
MAKSKIHSKIQKIIGHFMVLLGIYLFSAGLIGNYSLIPVLKSSIFWGIFLLIIAISNTLKA